MLTQIESAREGIITPQMAAVAADEALSAEFVRSMVAEGRIVIPWNHSRRPTATGIGEGLRTKVNASIGTSSDIIDYAGRGGQGAGSRGKRGRHPDGTLRGGRPGPGAARGDRRRRPAGGQRPALPGLLRGGPKSTATPTGSTEECSST